MPKKGEMSKGGVDKNAILRNHRNVFKLHYSERDEHEGGYHGGFT